MSIHSFKLSDEFVNNYSTKEIKWGSMGEFTYLRTYSRFKEDGSKERWHDTVRRVVEGTFNVQKRHCDSLKLPWNNSKAQKSAQIMFDKIFNFKFIPPGRGLWMAGTKFVDEKGSAALNNCGFVSTKDILTRGSFPFTWTMDALMLGVGIGFDTKGAHKISIQQPKPDGVFVIPDSREGWVESLKKILDGFFNSAPIPTMDYSQVRKYGEPIKGFGGVASGPEPLKILHESVTKLLTNKIGHKISSTDIVDIMNMIGKCVVAGNVRRSAEIAIGSWDDEEYTTMKDYNKYPDELKSHRWASNNSVFAEVGKTDYNKIADSIALNGEPGVVWLENIRAFSRMNGIADWKDEAAVGLNPCFTADTLVHTKKGHFPIHTLVGKEVEVHDGNSWVTIDNFRVTGENQNVLSITLHDGSVIKATPYHKFVLNDNSIVEAKDLKINDSLMISSAENTHGDISVKGAYIKGFLIGDGTVGRDGPLLYLYEPKYPCIDRLISSANELPIGKINTNAISILDFVDQSSPKLDKITERKFMRGITARSNELLSFGGEYKETFPEEAFTWDYKSKCEFIAGVMDADGGSHDTRNGWMYQISSIHREWLLGFQSFLKTIGVFSKLSKYKESGFTDFNDGYGYYPTKDIYRLTISQESSIVLSQQVTFSRLTSFANKKTTYNLKPKWNRIVAIEDAGIADKVYCCTVPTNHTFSLTCGVRTGQCAEQSLESGELCCLVETFPSLHSTLEEYIDTLKYAYLYAKTVTLIPTHWSETNAILLKNRRIGLSQSGIIDAFVEHGRDSMVNEWNIKAYDSIQKYDKIYSDWFCIPRSKKTTSVKPSGTVSLLAGVSPGIHYPHSEYYIRRIRVATESPLVEAMKNAGYDVNFEVYGDDEERKKTSIISFPIHEKNFSKKKSDVTIWEQVKNAVDYQRTWADNSVSITVSFNKKEAKEIASVLFAFERELKAISFLPLSDHGYEMAPYEEITKEQYEEMYNKTSKPDFSKSIEGPSGSKFCDGDSCTI